MTSEVCARVNINITLNIDSILHDEIRKTTIKKYSQHLPNKSHLVAKILNNSNKIQQKNLNTSYQS